MTPGPSPDMHSLSEAGTAALRAGDAAKARAQFEAIIASGRAEAYHWVCLALACKALRDEDRMVEACDGALAADPHNLSALIMKGDHLVSRRNVRAATQFYGVAVAIASRMNNLPEPMAAEIRRAADARDRINAHIAEHLRVQLSAAGYDEAASSRRFTQSLEILTGRKQPYFQQPRAYYFPELPQIQFYERDVFPWLEAVEAETADICGELEQVMQDEDRFAPYIQGDPDLPGRNDHSLLGSRDWSACYLWKDGAPVPGNAERCPKTLAALEHAPLTHIRGRTPSILFSVLRPGARIEPHSGFLNTRLICHLPLIVPPGCHLRVGNETREWKKGEAWVFDDTIEHEARNTSDRTRVVLIFDIWRPELTPEERGLVAAMMEAVDTYGGGQPVKWNA